MTLNAPTLVPGTKTTYTQTAERTIVFERTYPCAPETLYKALTDPKRIPEWWGPPGVKTTVLAMDVKVGGTWKFTQDGPRKAHVMNGIYRVLDPPRKIVSTFQYEGAPFTINETYELLPKGTGTILRLTSEYPSGSALGGMIQSGMDSDGGWLEGLRHQWRLERLAQIAGVRA